VLERLSALAYVPVLERLSAVAYVPVLEMLSALAYVPVLQRLSALAYVLALDGQCATFVSKLQATHDILQFSVNFSSMV
jgi:hypothetical protein